MPKSKPQAYLRPEAWKDLQRLPGNARRRITEEIDRLEINPRPSNSKRLTLENELREVRRLRVGHWRVVYWLDDGQPVIIGIKKRPPYDYEDVQRLLEGE
ncbi:MAG: type II toxin-antitoxin system RelE family toxin [Chloroflexota bacterium]